MPNPYGYSGLIGHNDTCSSKSVSSAMYRASVQSGVKMTDMNVYEAALTGRGKPYILMAVVKQRSDARIAEFFREKLPLEISTAFKARHSTSPNSILYNTLLKICSKYKAISAYGESIFAYTVSTIVLLDVQAGSLTRVHFGTEAVPAVVLNSQGHACQPDSSQRHYIDSNFVHEESFSTLPGQHSVVLGSPGLWQYIHPAKAAVHAFAYGLAHPYLSTDDNRHDAASAVVHAALRTIVQRLASSPDPRTAVLHNLQQLDRLPPGSMQEASRRGLVPRRRGDIHPDLTSAVLQFTLHRDNTASNSMTHTQSCPILQSAASTASDSSASCSVRATFGRLFKSRSRPDMQNSRGLSKDLFSRRSAAPSASLDTSTRSMPTSPSVASPIASPSPVRFVPSDSQLQESTDAMGTMSSDASTPKASKEGLRRWQLVQTHVSTIKQENDLRLELWDSAVSLALSQRTTKGEMDRISGDGSVPVGSSSGGGDAVSAVASSSESGSQGAGSSSPDTPKSGDSEHFATLDEDNKSVISSWNFDSAQLDAVAGG